MHACTPSASDSQYCSKTISLHLKLWQTNNRTNWDTLKTCARFISNTFPYLGDIIPVCNLSQTSQKPQTWLASGDPKSTMCKAFNIFLYLLLQFLEDTAWKDIIMIQFPTGTGSSSFPPHTHKTSSALVHFSHSLCNTLYWVSHTISFTGASGG